MAHEASVLEMRGLEDKYKECVNRLRATQVIASENLKAAKEVQKDLDEFTVKVKATEEKMHDEAQKLITQHAMRARVETMMEYFKGEHVSWDMNETVRKYNEAYPEDAFPLHVPGNVEPPAGEVGTLDVAIVEGKLPSGGIVADDGDALDNTEKSL